MRKLIEGENVKILCDSVLISSGKKKSLLGEIVSLKILRRSVFKIFQSEFNEITIPESGDHLLFVFVPAPSHKSV